MKKRWILPLACFATVFSATAQNKSSHAKDEIIIEQQDVKNGTTIEIKNGEVFIDGKKVADDNDPANKDAKVKVYTKKRMFVNGKEVPVTDQEENDTDLFNWGPNDSDNNKPMLGVTTKPSKNNDGAEVEFVTPNSPAQELGLQTGDIITRINDKNIYNPKDLVEAIGAFKPGDMIDVTFDRNNKLMTKNVKLSERNDVTTFRSLMPFDERMMNGFEPLMRQFESNGFSSPLPSKAPAPKIGVSVEDRADGDGVFVQEVTTQSAAAKAGIQKNDVITQYGKNSIHNVDELLDAISSHQQNSQVDILVKRNGQTKTLHLQVPKVLKKKDL